MPANNRPRRERTDDWQKIQQYTLWPEQKVYELLRPVVLFNESATERARETGAAERSVRRKAGQFEEHGMSSLFEQAPKEDAEDKSRRNTRATKEPVLKPVNCSSKNVEMTFY
jgi:hypothetical protein